MAPKSKNSRPLTATTRAAKTVWNEDCDRILVSVLEQAKREGLVANNGFKTTVWKRAEEALRGTKVTSGGPAKSAPACTTRFATLKKEYKQVKFFFTGGASGFGWDEEMKTVTAPNSVWDDFIAKHPHLEKWRDRTFPLYEELGSLIDGRYATGKNVFHAGADTESEYGGNETQDRQGSIGHEIPVEDSQHLADQSSCSHSPLLSPMSARLPNSSDTPSQSSTSTPPDNRQKRRAVDGENSVVWPAKRSRGHGRGQRANAAGSLEHIAEGLQDIARAFSLDSSPAPHSMSTSLSADTEPPMHVLDTLSSPSRRRIAIRAVEQDSGLSPLDFIKAVKFIQQDVGVADAYLAMQETANRTAFIASLLSDD
ncbi:hypothetical protein BDY19DRAFT_935476 [Irpex rosettiformis]|uniref:Uncharacterized protein n=1 Tax=Irpex rosettiformis TaxID=378272 RepID=A0ACB8U8C9_9APHY|nr:hypothetical protein BDY19DRAFT_935476 [Irpex rosettiformis]